MKNLYICKCSLIRTAATKALRNIIQKEILQSFRCSEVGPSAQRFILSLKRIHHKHLRYYEMKIGCSRFPLKHFQSGFATTDAYQTVLIQMNTLSVCLETSNIYTNFISWI